ncbi:hypothetical protein HYDPIDRAFT_91129, partial [Hydnomerulius pinastri MD-312]
KMRAAMIYAFGHIHGLGTVHWQEDNPGSGHFVGNPSVSQQVSNYMCSLWQCKVCGFFLMTISILTWIIRFK